MSPNAPPGTGKNLAKGRAGSIRSANKMNLVFPSFCIIVAGAAGYFLEPQLEATLLKQNTTVAVTQNNAPASTPAEPESAPVAKQDSAPTPAPTEVTPVPVPEVADTPKTPEPEPETPPAPPEEIAKTDSAASAGGDDLLPPPPPLGELGGGSKPDEAKSAAIVELMKSSIRDGQVSEFTVDQVIGWKAAGMETFDGETYQVGLAAYKTETIFGIKTLEAKALIKGDKVVKWIWSKSKLEIK